MGVTEPYAFISEAGKPTYTVPVAPGDENTVPACRVGSHRLMVEAAKDYAARGYRVGFVIPGETLWHIADKWGGLLTLNTDRGLKFYVSIKYVYRSGKPTGKCAN